MSHHLLDTDQKAPADILSRLDAHIRLAQPPDAPAIAPLFYQIWQDMGLPLTAPRQTYLSALANGIAADQGRFAHSHTLVYIAQDGALLGALAAYRAEDEPQLTQQTLACLVDAGLSIDAFLSLEPESQAGEYYLDSLCVMPQARGQGVGTALLRTHQLLAAYRQVPLSLLVDRQNPRAHALYQRLGFHDHGRRTLASHAYIIMRYTHEDAERDFASLLSQLSS